MPPLADRVGTRLIELRRAAAQPLIAAQGVTSVYGLLSTFVAARVLDTPAFVTFTLLTLTQGIAVGLVQASVLEPSLVALRRDAAVRARCLHVMAAQFPVLLVTVTVYRFAAGVSLEEGLVLTATTSLPILHAWSRTRAMAANRFAVVLVSDVVRLVLVLVVSAVALTSAGELGAVDLQSAFLACAAPAALVPMSVRSVRTSYRTPYSIFAPMARWQLPEFVIAQLQTSTPLLVLAAQTSTPLVGAFRLAQTLVGPANLLYIALSTNFLAVTSTSGRTDAQVIRTGRRAALLITTATLAVVLLAIGAALLASTLFPAVSKPDLLVAVACVGAVSCTSASAGVHSVILRSLFLQRTVAAIRAILTGVSWLGFFAGYAIAGVSGSMVVGFVASAIGNPLVVNLRAHFVYRQRLARDISG